MTDHFIGEVVTEIINAQVCVILIRLRAEKEGIRKEEQNVVSKKLQVFRTPLKAMDKHYQMRV